MVNVRLVAPPLWEQGYCYSIKLLILGEFYHLHSKNNERVILLLTVKNCFFCRFTFIYGEILLFSITTTTKLGLAPVLYLR